MKITKNISRPCTGASERANEKTNKRASEYSGDKCNCVYFGVTFIAHELIGDSVRKRIPRSKLKLEYEITWELFSAHSTRINSLCTCLF